MLCPTHTAIFGDCCPPSTVLHDKASHPEVLLCGPGRLLQHGITVIFPSIAAALGCFETYFSGELEHLVANALPVMLVGSLFLRKGLLQEGDLHGSPN
jgi:hypothetical protein